MNSKKYSKKIRRKNKTQKKGGKVLSSGGFGCIFRPALKCKNKERIDKNITKLMKKSYAETEYNDVVKYLPELQKIPNYSKYFLVSGFTTCIPDKLSESDLDNFDEKCSALKKMGIKKDNINDNLKKLMSINMPYGGVDVGDYINKNEKNLDYNNLILLNNSLIELINNGIVPMNKINIYHCDVKESNILVNNELETKLIDWGLSTTYKNEKKIPHVLSNRPFQYNVPFSIILFNEFFNEKYKEFLKKNQDPSYIEIRSFVINYVIEWIEKRGPGHLKTLNTIFKKLFEEEVLNVDANFREQLIEFTFTFYFIFEYISKILHKYTKNNKLEIMEYFSDVFLKNIDVWGFVMTYIPIVDFLYEKCEGKIDKLNENEINIYKKLREIMLLIVEANTTPIDINKLTKLLKELNPLFLTMEKNKKSTGGNLDKKLKKTRKSKLKNPNNSFIRSFYA